MSQGYFFYLDYRLIEKYNEIKTNGNLSPGDLRIIFPKDSNRKNLSYSLEEIKTKREPIRNIVLSNLENYTKYRDIDYGQVRFYNEANIILENKIQKESKDAREIIESLKKEIALEKNRCEEERNRQSNELAELIRQNEKYLLEISSLEEELFDLKNSIEKEESKILNSYKKKLQSKRAYISWLESNRERPNKLEDIPDWVENHLAGRLIFHDRAKNEIKSTKNNIDVKIVCDSLDYLAWEYYDYLFNDLDKDTMYSLCSKKYQRPFDVGGSGNMSVEYYPVDYKIKYKTGFKGKPVETPLNMHLKIGNDNKNILRIYFLIDKEEELIVVGSLPDHLPTLNF